MIKIMSASALDELWGIGGSDCRLEAGETLFRGGDVVRRLYRVVDGLILLVRPLPHGADLIIQRARAGDIVAEASLFAETYHCDAVARGIACVRGVPVGRVNDLIERRPDLARALVSLYAAEVQRARTKAEIASLKTVAMRLDAWLSLHHGGLPGKGRWHEIAAEIAVSPAALYRELAARGRSTNRHFGNPARHHRNSKGCRIREAAWGGKARTPSVIVSRPTLERNHEADRADPHHSGRLGGAGSR